MNEADTCRKFVVPLLQAAGWDNDPHSITEQRLFTKGRIVVRGNQAERRKRKRTDYLLPRTLPPISQHGTVGEIVGVFGRPDKLRAAITELQATLYAA